MKSIATGGLKDLYLMGAKSHDEEEGEEEEEEEEEVEEEEEGSSISIESS